MMAAARRPAAVGKVLPGAQGIATRSIDTTAAVRLVKQGGGFLIDRIALTLRAKVPGLDEAAFQKIAQDVKQNCPLSKALKSVPEITLVATRS